MGERTIAALRLAGEGDLPGIARPMVAAGAVRLGLDEESAAHLADATALVAEGGRAMVDPRYRGHHVMKHLTSFRRDLVGDLGLFGVYADSVTEHTRSQALYGGAEQPVTGLLLGYLPPTVSFRRIEIDGVPKRQAVVMSYHPQRDHHEMTVHPPVVALDVLRRIYDSHELPRHFGEGAAPAAGTTSRIESRVWKDIGAALLVIEEPGADLRDAVRARLRSLRGAGIDVVYADVPLSHPGTPAAGEVLNGLGFVFGGVIPLLRDGGDVLRMQHLGDLDVDPDEIHLLSTMAQDILEYVLERREAVS